ncbi:MAG: carboxypeptidase M32, partial [Thermoleophilia bacterium]|nr:carboxypeptidase M32 [Thermoleophilia bacterium]
MDERTDAAWGRLREWMGVLADLGHTGGVLEWDRETIMPPGGAGARAAQLATISALAHRELLRPEVEDDLALLDADPDPDRAAAVRLARRERTRAARVPEALVRAETEAASRCLSAWVEARPREDLPGYLAHLRPLVALKREQAAALADGGEHYDALLEEYEPGARAADIAVVLEDLITRVRPLLDALDGAGAPPLPARAWPGAEQVGLGREVAAELGYDLRCGHIGETAHPVTMTLGAGDVRFSTRVDEADPFSSLMAV